ncbi:DUF3140 domain-containing protein [Salinarimonas soli]|uniref:DUF3140 domain-containing protein n=1 Tax=Salinarimonas soli TaxID=1638099 RepID=A0A5B2VHH4_9HYPH|nr:DUF3140 domain-containing protein [Salinarimonas soli]KAA2237802.1 DUF3140 domain-containing protein [Salinarimonas soli]
MSEAAKLDRDAIWKDFHEAVNMTASAIEAHLATPESQSVGWTHDGEGEAVGHKEGRRLVEIKHKKKAELSDGDYAHMRKAVGYVHRHLAQGGPADDREHSRWRYSLMNWGHDPLKG